MCLSKLSLLSHPLIIFPPSLSFALPIYCPCFTSILLSTSPPFPSVFLSSISFYILCTRVLILLGVSLRFSLKFVSLYFIISLPPSILLTCILHLPFFFPLSLFLLFLLLLLLSPYLLQQNVSCCYLPEINPVFYTFKAPDLKKKISFLRNYPVSDTGFQSSTSVTHFVCSLLVKEMKL